MPPPPRAFGGWVPLPPPAGEAMAARAASRGDDMASLKLLPAGAAIVPRSRFLARRRKLKPERKTKKSLLFLLSLTLSFVHLPALYDSRAEKERKERRVFLSLSLSSFLPFTLLLSIAGARCDMEPEPHETADAGKER